MNPLTLLSWTHPVIGDITEAICARHAHEVRAALYVLGVGCSATEGPDELACLRCLSPISTPPRDLLRQWYGGVS